MTVSSPSDSEISREELQKDRALLEKQMLEACGKVLPEEYELVKAVLQAARAVKQ
jgi:RNA polymerase-interacting CarD/CdnL/TRCF family regulator